jgi:hypothetical protein
MDTPFTPINVFYVCAEKDIPLLANLEHHLSFLQQKGMIASWHRGQITAGKARQQEIDAHLKAASLILLLISPDLLYAEMEQALQRQIAGQARVVPVYLRPVDWQSTPVAHLQALPKNDLAITLWTNQDAAWVDVAQGLREVVEELLTSARTAPAIEVTRAASKAFPAVWNVPYRYSFIFTGRDPVIEELFARFTTEHSSGLIPTQAISGLGGMGKTQTAVQYAYLYRQQYRTVLWLNAETEEALLASLRAVGEPFTRAGAPQDRQSLLAHMQEWFRTATDWLLILDNADNIAWLDPFLPLASRGHLLLTTRAMAQGELASSFSLTQLSPDEGALCLLRRAKLLEPTEPLSKAPEVRLAAACELSQLMGGLPLALEQAGAYIEATGRGVKDYLTLYRQYRSVLQNEKYGPVPTYREPVALAWKMARTLVQQDSPAALELLYLCAFLAPHAIPYDFFTAGFPLLGPLLGPLSASPVEINRLVTILRKHSLIRTEVDRDSDIARLSIHPVLQEVLRDSLDPPARKSRAGLVVQAVNLVGSLIAEPMMRIHAQHATRLWEEIRGDA